MKSIIIVGGGPGGYVAAIRAAQLGAKVKLIERDKLGGTCLNAGCIPTKCLIHSAELMDEIRSNSAELGIRVSEATVDFPQVIKHKNSISAKLARGVEGLLKNGNIEVINGEASFIAERTLQVSDPDGNTETMTADGIILATGSVNATPPIKGLKDNINCIDSTAALKLESLPESMIVIGGGVIGLELACAYGGLGTKVVVIEALDHILPMLDEDIVAVGVKKMKRLGVKLLTESPVQSIEESPLGASVVCRNAAGKELVFEAEKVLIAVGRKPNTQALKLECGGIENDRGSVIVNERMQTNVEGVYAIGDCVKGYSQLAHTASLMGEIAVENIMGLDRKYDEASCPRCVYIEPEAAAVGITEQEAIKRGIDYSVGSFRLAGNGKSLILNGGLGLVKLIADADNKKLLGMHIIGPRATDLISEGALAIKMGASVDDIIETIHSHPTISESVREAALNVENRSIHGINS